MLGQDSGALRRGWSTGARAAFAALLTGRFPDPVLLRLPRGRAASFPLALAELGEDGARAGIIKDAGDDPDVTHGALIVAEVAPAPAGSGIRLPRARGSAR
jgi:cobalt-precorrin-5B (C1)-methyltransferase